MQTTQIESSSVLPTSSKRYADNLVYQSVTVAAMALLLLSLWVF